MNARIAARARAAGIILTPQGEPLFARDIERMREIRATPEPRTPAQIAEDEAAERAAKRARR